VTSDEELRQLRERHREAAQHMPADEFCLHVINNEVPRLYVAVLLRDFYGLDLGECKRLIGASES